MSLTLIGKKEGMTQLFDAEGNSIAVTAIRVLPNVISQIKTKEKDQYLAIQLGTQPQKKNVTDPLKGHFKKKNLTPMRFLHETRVDNVEEYSLGQAFDVTVFEIGDVVDVCGISKGKGFQGVIKLHNFKGGPGAHGSGFHRHAGSTGMRTTPGRCLPDGKRASRMGNDRVTIQNLKVIQIDSTRNLLFVSGAVPGSIGAKLLISKGVKAKKVAKKG